MIGHCQKLSHDKGGYTHDRGHQNAPCRGGCLDSAGVMRRIARALHGRNGNGPGGQNVRDGTAADASEKPAGHDRHFSRAALETPEKG